MKKLLVATLVGMCSAAAPLPAAQADGPGWVGTCRISIVNGGQNVWNGQVNIAVAATTPGELIEAAGCSIRVNGGGMSTILTAPLPVPAPVAVAAGRATFTAAVTDSVEICTTVNLGNVVTTCFPLTTILVNCPEICDTVGPGPLPPTDPIICSVLVTLAPTVDGLPTSGALSVDPTGDVYVGGTTRRTCSGTARHTSTTSPSQQTDPLRERAMRVKKLLVAAVVGIVAAAPLPAAQADGPGWRGTCRIRMVEDRTPDGSLGGPGAWNGEVDILVAATSGATISEAWCGIRINDGAESRILTATAAGGMAVGVAHAVFRVEPTDTVELCTHVTTSSHGTHAVCPTDVFYTTPLCPWQVCGEGSPVDQVIALIEGLVPPARTAVRSTTCPSC